jgi:hypothetical protein
MAGKTAMEMEIERLDRRIEQRFKEIDGILKSREWVKEDFLKHPELKFNYTIKPGAL